jgi:hypothetical protein
MAGCHPTHRVTHIRLLWPGYNKSPPVSGECLDYDMSARHLQPGLPKPIALGQTSRSAVQVIFTLHFQLVHRPPPGHSADGVGNIGGHERFDWMGCRESRAMDQGVSGVGSKSRLPALNEETKQMRRWGTEGRGSSLPVCCPPLSTPGRLSAHLHSAICTFIVLIVSDLGPAFLVRCVCSKKWIMSMSWPGQDPR